MATIELVAYRFYTEFCAASSVPTISYEKFVESSILKGWIRVAQFAINYLDGIYNSK
jgi:hypothetical protein